MRTAFLIGASVTMLAGTVIASMSLGAFYISARDVLQVLATDADGVANSVVWDVRLPRAVAAAMIGALLGASGALLQTITRNALAAPGLLGVNSGAALAVVLLIFLSNGIPGTPSVVLAALAGSLSTTLLILMLAGRDLGSDGPLRLILAGAAVTLLFGALSTALLIVDERTLGEVRVWLSGSLSAVRATTVWQLLPFAVIALALCMLITRLAVLVSLGNQVATGLGVDAGTARILVAGTAACLAGLAVALAGPIAFIGLVAPHIARAIVGAQHRLLVPEAALIGAILLLLADIASRLMLAPAEIPVGIMTAAVGAPFLLLMLGRLR